MKATPCRTTSILAALSLLASAAGAQERATAFAFEDFFLVPLRVHLLTATDRPDLATTLGEADFARFLPKMNQVWAQAGVHFYLESLVKEEGLHAAVTPDIVRARQHRWLLELPPPKSSATNAFNVYYVKEFSANGVYFPKGIFVKDTASLKPIEGGIDEPLPRVTAHELGHALNLQHRQDTTNLMASGTTGTWLNAAEIKKSRAAAGKLAWIESAAAVKKKADELRAAQKDTEARALYQRLSTLPVKCDAVEQAKERAAR
jgi:hypothetical protein